MRILILSQWFDPEPTFKGLTFAKELVKLGHQVEVLTGFPNYPGGKVYSGYRIKFVQRETIDGISIIRVPLYPSHDSSALKRIANYVSFAFSAALWGALLVKPADVMYVYHPPATVGCAALVISRVRRIPFVYDIQDLWPDTLAATGMLNNPSVLKLVNWVCMMIYRRAARIVVLSPGFKKMLALRNVPSEKIEIIYNWCDEKNIQRESNSDLTQKMGFAGRFNIVFAGTMGKAQALDSVLASAKIVAESHPKVQFVFVGSGIDVAHLKQRASELSLDNVLFLPRMPIEEIGSILAAADVLLVHLRDDPLFSITLPSKIQAYMAVGRPILMAVRGDASGLVKESKSGVVCNPEDPASLAAAVAKLCSMTQEDLHQMGQNGKAFYAANLSLPVGVDKFQSIFIEVNK